jgi:DNA-binding GntR family transcriptional regulator
MMHLQGRDFNVAKKVFPLSIDVKERRILEALSARDGVSMAEAMRRLIRSALETPPARLEQAATDNAH